MGIKLTAQGGGGWGGGFGSHGDFLIGNLVSVTASWAGIRDDARWVRGCCCTFVVCF